MALELRMPTWIRPPTWMRGGAAHRERSWFWLEPRYPSVAFDLEPKSLAMVRVGRRKKERFLASFEVQEIPPGVIEIDFFKARLSAPDRFQGLLARMIEKDPVNFNRASLLLPDSYARVAILPFEEMPRSRHDALDLVRWRTKKAVPFKVEDAAVDYAVLPGSGPGVNVLAVLTPRTIVQEIESAFEQAGVHAGLVDLSTFSLLNLYRSVFEAEVGGGSEFLVANVTGTFVTFVIFRGPQMVFFRCKPFGVVTGEDSGDAARRLLKRELQTSLLYYREKLEGKGLSRAYLRVVDLDPEIVTAVFSSEPDVGSVRWIDPRKVVSLDGRMTGEHGERILQRLAPALGAAARRGAE